MVNCQCGQIKCPENRDNENKNTSQTGTTDGKPALVSITVMNFHDNSVGYNNNNRALGIGAYLMKVTNKIGK